ncbi:MAG: hypothetical protein IOB85_09280 [Methylobacterium sp.]|nr:hypothetical protein [Methylobacterium sp.]MCA3672587.1 hypothetical protein [Methylobacterium sp.]MCA3676691.1 hypothetical protein [Methylobacterium sp.]MCA3681127.1 hypothetical protein [Methylobacterium sp.]MCA3682769.1 hypothetical protein [Methylobacterium sp.]
MANSSKSTDAARAMLRNLEAAEALAATLTATAPITMAAAGGADQLVASYGQPTGALFWSIQPMPEPLWEQMAAEHQATIGPKSTE